MEKTRNELSDEMKVHNQMFQTGAGLLPDGSAKPKIMKQLMRQALTFVVVSLFGNAQTHCLDSWKCRRAPYPHSFSTKY